jgi:hypothetical protein
MLVTQKLVNKREANGKVTPLFFSPEARKYPTCLETCVLARAFQIPTAARRG